MPVAESQSGHSLFRITYTTVGDVVAHWDLWALDKAHAIGAAQELLPIGSKLTNVYLLEEW